MLRRAVLAALALTVSVAVALGAARPAQAAACSPTTTIATVSGVAYKVFRFSTVGTCTWTAPGGTVDFLVVGGGGGGGGAYAAGGNPGAGGGGGGGEVASGSWALSAGTSVIVTVGGGGLPGDRANASSAGSGGQTGGQSQFGSSFAAGGYGGQVGVNGEGGSGGNSGRGNLGGKGGRADGSLFESGGGGAGDGAAGGVGSDIGGGGANGGAGGVGTQSGITGETAYYGGGGGGGGSVSGASGAGGQGGGGTPSITFAVRSGTDGLGGGGAGGYGMVDADPNRQSGGMGGDGVVIARVAIGVPGAPTSPTVTPGDRQIAVAFTAGADNGDAIGNYEYSLNNGTWTALDPADASSPITIGGLTNGIAYEVRIRAVNGAGAGSPLTAGTATPYTDPGAPTGVTTTAGDRQLTATWTAPADDGGYPILDYTAQAHLDGVAVAGRTCTVAASASPLSCAITGLANGSGYTVRVTARTAVGTSAASAASDARTPYRIHFPAAGAIDLRTATYRALSSFMTGSEVPRLEGFSGDVRVTVDATNAKVRLTRTAGLGAVTGYPQSAWTSGAASLGFRGAVADVNAALETIEALGTSAGTAATITLDVSSGSAAYDPATGRYYEYVDTGVTWVEARCRAKYTNATFSNGATPDECVATDGQPLNRRTLSGAPDGLRGYLATSTSAAENAFIASKVGTAPAWLGGTDRGHDKDWRWVDGPEAGLSFLHQTGYNASGPNSCGIGGTAVAGRYNQWNGSEPNDYSDGCANRENALQIISGGNGNWNDLPEASHTMGYVVEYGGDGGVAPMSGTASTDGTVRSAPTVVVNAVSGLTTTGATLNGTVNPGGNATTAEWTHGTAADLAGGTSAAVGGSMTGSSPVSVPLALTGLVPNTLYRQRLSATSAVGTDTSAISTFTTLPPTPTDVTATRANAALDVAWTIPAPIGAAGVTWTATASPHGLTCTSTGATAACTIAGLQNGTAYTVTVRGANAGGNGTASVASAPVTPATVPGTPATSSSLRLIADNDFAVLTGTSANVTRLFYQNDVDWTSQIAAATTVDVTLEPGETHLYVVGMGGGGSEDLAGKINGVDITQIADAQRAVIPGCSASPESSASNCYLLIDPSLVDGSATNGNQGRAYASSLGQVAGGSFAVRLVDVQSALAGATWQTLPGGGAYPFRSSSPVGCSGASPTPNRCFDVPDSRAVVFRFAAGDLDVPVLAGNRSVTVRWSQPASNGGSAITSYDLQQSVDGTTWSDPASTTACTPAADRCRVVTGLTNGTPYRFRVRAANAVGPGSWSAATSQATPSGPPGAPTGLALVPADGTATATWAAPDSGGIALTGYTVEVDAGSGWAAATTTACPTPADTCRVLTGLANGTAHAVRVTAANANGPGPASASASTTPRTVPGAPRNVAASRGVRSLTVAFDPPASNGGAAITNYAYALSTDGGATWGAFTDLSPASTASPLTIPGLADDAPYAVRVRAVNAAGDGAASAEATARTFALPAAPTAVQARAGVGLATVTWGAPDDGGTPVTGYTVTASPGGRTCEWSGGTLDCVVTGLANGVEYTFTVTATNAVGTGPASAASAPVTPRLAQVPAATVEELARDSTEVSRGGAARVAVACGEGGPCRTAVRMRIGDQVLTTTGTLQPGESSTAGIDLPPDVQRRLARQGRLTVTVTIQIASEAGTIAVSVELELEAPPADRAADWSGRPRTDGSTDVTATCEGPIVTRCEGILTLYVDDPAVGAARQGGRIAVGTVAVAGPAGHPIKVNAKINRRGRQILARKRTIRIAPSVVFEGQTDPGRIRPYRLTLMSEQEWLRAALATLWVGGRPRADLNVLLDEVRGGRLDAATAADRIEEDILRRRLTGQAAALDLPVPPRALVPIERDLRQAFALSVAANRHYLAYLRTGDDDRWGSAWRLSARATDIKARMMDRFAEAGRRLGVDVPSAAPRWP